MVDPADIVCWGKDFLPKLWSCFKFSSFTELAQRLMTCWLLFHPPFLACITAFCFYNFLEVRVRQQSILSDEQAITSSTPAQQESAGLGLTQMESCALWDYNLQFLFSGGLLFPLHVECGTMLCKTMESEFRS